MPVISTDVNVGTARVRLDSGLGSSIVLFNSGALSVFVGGSTVTAATGTPVGAGSWSPSLDLNPGDGLYGIVASGSSDVRVLEVQDVIGDPLDLVTLLEAKLAVSITDLTDTQFDLQLATYITAVSRYLDELCGAIVTRTVTDEIHTNPDRTIYLRQAPTSRTGVTSVVSVTEYVAGVAAVLTEETLTASGSSSFLVDPTQGSLIRRSSFNDYSWGGGSTSTRVAVTYTTGRYASTAAVDAKFKLSALEMLQNLWRLDLGGGTVTLGGYDTTPGGIATFALPNEVKGRLVLEFLPPVVA